MKCIIIDDDVTSTVILKKYISMSVELELVGDFQNPVEAIPFIKENQPEMIFLDVEMPEMSGMEFLNLMTDFDFKVVLTTSHSEFALDAYKFNVTGYLVKPVKYDAFMLAVKKALRDQSPKTLDFKENFVFIKVDKAIVKVNLSDIILVECTGDYASLYTKEKKYLVRSTMKTLENRFSTKDYLRVHRSYIVRMDSIIDIQDDSISCGNKLIPIGKTYKTEVYKRLNFI